MTMKEEVKRKSESFFAQYPATIDFPRKGKEFQEAHSRLFALIEYVLKHSNDFTNEDDTFHKHWETWRRRGLISQQPITTVKRSMKLNLKGCLVHSYMQKISEFPRLQQFVTMEYVAEPQPLMRLTNKFSMRLTPNTKLSTTNRRWRSVSPRKTRSLTPRKKSTSTPPKDGGVQKTPTVNNLTK